jgi:hypothetical protein
MRLRETAVSAREEPWKPALTAELKQTQPPHIAVMSKKSIEAGAIQAHGLNGAVTGSWPDSISLAPGEVGITGSRIVSELCVIEDNSVLRPAACESALSSRGDSWDYTGWRRE